MSRPLPLFNLQLPDEEEPGLGEDFDADIAAIFGEEATELLEQSEAAFARWRADRADVAQVTELKRLLHTLKGGARMAGIRAMGDLSHEVESFLAAIESGTSAGDAAAFDVLQSSLDELHRMREMANSGQRLPSARDLILRIRALAAAPAIVTAVEPVVAPASVVPAAEVMAAAVVPPEAVELTAYEPVPAIELPVEEVVLETLPVEEIVLETSPVEETPVETVIEAPAEPAVEPVDEITAAAAEEDFAAIFAEESLPAADLEVAIEAEQPEASAEPAQPVELPVVVGPVRATLVPNPRARSKWSPRNLNDSWCRPLRRDPRPTRSLRRRMRRSCRGVNPLRRRSVANSRASMRTCSTTC